jgi:hypothetical protein
MKPEGDLKERFHAADAHLAVGEPPIGRIVARGRRRRARAIGGSAIAALALGVALTLSLSVLLPTHPGGRSSVGSEGGALRTSLVGLGMRVTYPSEWTLLLGALGGSVDSEKPVLQLTNFDPGVIGQDPQASWLCPLQAGQLPPDGVLLVVEWPGQANGSLPPWPVGLPSEASPEAFCGTGSQVAWEANGQAFRAFAAFGPEAAGEDQNALVASFSSFTFSSKFEDYWMGHRRTPAAVLASIDAFGSSWNLAAFTEFHDGLSPGCLGVFGAGGGGGGGCYVKADGTLNVLGPQFGNDDLVWSGSSTCGTGQYLLFGMVTLRADSVELVLLNGQTIPMELVDLPTSWDVPYRAWVGAVENPPTGEDVSPSDGNVFRDAGRFVLRDTHGNVISTVPFTTSAC